MADDRRRTGAADANRVHVGADVELRSRTARFACTPARQKVAGASVDAVDAVERHLAA